MFRNANAAGISKGARVLIDLRYRFILHDRKADALPFDKHRRDSLAEFAEFDRICIFLAVMSWSG